MAKILRLRRVLLIMAAGFGTGLFALPLQAQQDAPPPPPAEAPAQDQSGPPPPPPGPVGGIEDYRPGAPNLGRSFLVPRLTLGQSYDSNVGYAPTTGSAVAGGITTLTGGLSLQAVGRNSTLSLDYGSTGLIYDNQAQPNGTIQNLAVTDKFTLRRWNLLFGENLSYLPNSAFGLGGLGFGGAGATGFPGVGGVTSFNPGTIPTQTIGSPNVSQLSSSSSFQAQINFSGNSSLNASAVIGFLHYFGSGMLNSRQITPRVSYDHGLTRRDTLTLSYSATLFDYTSTIPGTTSHYIQLGYRRLLSQRFVFSVLAGPVITTFSPAPGQMTVPGGSTSVSWSVNSTFAYQGRRASLTYNYSHGVSPGSGFFAGTTLDQATANGTYRFSRSWSGGVSGSLARNQSLSQTNPGGPAAGIQSFTYWTAGATLSRNVGKYSSLNFNYNASHQSGTTTTCASGIACGPIALVQVAGVSFNWSTRPLRLD